MQLQFESDEEITTFDSYEMNFRLFKAKSGNINLELICRDDFGMFCKPIGFYLSANSGDSESNKLTLIILNEFVNDFKSVEIEGGKDLDVKYMSIRESGIIGAFSRETFQIVREMYKLKENGLPQSIINQIGPFPHLHAMQFDKCIVSNGLEIDLLFSFDQTPQSFLNDKYGVQGPIGVYYKEENSFRLNPVLEYQSKFAELYTMGLLTAFNTI